LDHLQQTLDTIKNLVHDTRAELDGQRLAGTSHRVPHCETRGFLVHLDGGRIGIQTDDLANELEVTHTHQLVHSGTRHFLGDHDGAGNGQDLA